MAERKLHLSRDLALPLEAVTQTFAILAMRGVGKTHTASVLAEELSEAGLPFVVLDPTGAWWGLRASADGKREGYPVTILGGDHGAVPLEEGAGKLIAWSEADVIACHSRHGVSPNPLYLRGGGVARVGCWPCIMARKREIANIAEQTPEVIDTIREMENEVTELAAARYAAKGETFESLGYQRPTFFQSPVREHEMDEHGLPVMERVPVTAWVQDGDDEKEVVVGHEMQPKVIQPCWPIDKVTEWARTSHGGKQHELFAPEREEGCVRWGLCESMQKDGEDKQ